MENLHIPSAERSPEVDFRFTEHRLALRGEAYPEDAAAFFGPILRALATHCEGASGQELRMDFQLGYFNTSSAKALMNLIQLLEQAARNGAQVDIHWHYAEGDDVIQEFGEDFSSELEHARFHLVQL
nr:DUF1987 domain-containing protein [uncultured Holophaga sp.]